MVVKRLWYNDGFLAFNFVTLFKILVQPKSLNQITKILSPKFKHFQDLRRIADRPKEYEAYSGSHSRRFEATFCIRLRNAGKNKTVNEVNSIQKGGFEFQSTIYTISCKCDDSFANLDNMYNAASVRGLQELSNVQGCRNFGAWGLFTVGDGGVHYGVQWTPHFYR